MRIQERNYIYKIRSKPVVEIGKGGKGVIKGDSEPEK